MNHICRVIVTTATIFVLSGCVFLGLREDVKLLDAATHITGTVEFSFDSKKPILVALFKKEGEGEPQPAAYAAVYGKANFQFLIGSGNYYLIAFEDKNEDFALQDDEYVGWYGNPAPILIEAGSGADYRNLTLSLKTPDQAKLELPQLYAPRESRALPEIESQHLGEVVTIDDPLFTQQVGRLGMWNPVKFFQQGYNGIFFLEPYDRDKIPVLLIHGISGSGGDWRYIIEKLDRNKYQPWIVQYPSGLRLGLLSEAINQSFTQMQIRYKFESAYIIAHSMGGLVARGIINKNLAQNEQSPVKLFVSISTPWSGHASASTGVDYAPVVVPSWYDMAPGSGYLNSLYENALPDFIPHYVLFSHGGGYSLLSDGNTDGVVSLRSQLPVHIQEKAEMVMGYDEGHVSILNSDAVVRKLDEIMNNAL